MKRTADYFLRKIASVADLPAPVAEIIQHYEPALRAQTILVAPPQEYAIVHRNRFFSYRFGQRTTPERTLVFGTQHLLVIEKSLDSTLEAILIPFDKLLHVEWTIVLLYSYVCFTWSDGTALRRLKIEYNGVGDALISAELQRLRMALRCSETDPEEPCTTDWTSVVRSLPLKFVSYLQPALFPGERLLKVVFQPSIGVSHRFSRTRLPAAQTIALTSEGVSLLEEATEVLNYGMVTRYLPSHAIREISFETVDDQVWLRFCLGTSEISDTFQLCLSRSNAQMLYDAFSQLASAIPIEGTAPQEA